MILLLPPRRLFDQMVLCRLCVLFQSNVELSLQNLHIESTTAASCGAPSSRFKRDTAQNSKLHSVPDESPSLPTRVVTFDCNIFVEGVKQAGVEFRFLHTLSRTSSL